MKNLFVFVTFLALSAAAGAGEKKIITSDGVELYVKVEGTGTPLLYLHGGPGSGSHWFEEFFGDFMEKQFTMIYLDQRGVGRSGNPKDGNFSMDRMVRDFEETREQLGYESWLTLGHSFGGVLQMGYAARKPQSVKGMIMVNCTLNITESACTSWAPKALEFLGETYGSCETDTLTVPERMANLAFRLREKGIFWKMAYQNQANEAVMDRTYDAIENFNFTFSNHVMSSINEYFRDFKPLAGKMHQPVLFYYGTRDWMVGPEHYKTVNFPNQMLWSNDGGHMPFLERKEDLEKAIVAYKRLNGF